MRTHTAVATIYGKIIRESDKAILFEIHKLGNAKLGEIKSEWFPLSQVTKIYSDSNNSNESYLVVSQWIIDKKDISAHIESDVEDTELAQEQTDEDSDTDCTDIPW